MPKCVGTDYTTALHPDVAHKFLFLNSLKYAYISPCYQKTAGNESVQLKDMYLMCLIWVNHCIIEWIIACGLYDNLEHVP